MDFRRVFNQRLKAATVDFLIILFITVAISVLLWYKSISLWYSLLILFTVSLLYITAFQSLPKAATVGMIIFKLKLTDADGNKVSFPKVFLRALSIILTSLPFGLGFFWAFSDSERKTLFDNATNTKVVLTVKNRVSVETKAFLIGIGKTFDGQKFPVGNGIIIGRDPASCSIVFAADEPAVSRMHCCVRYNRQTRMIFLEDINSSFGTFLWNGKRVQVGQTAALNDGESFYLGSKKNGFKVVVEKE